MLFTASSLLALSGTGSYKYPMSDNQSILNVYAKSVGYMNVELVPSDCGRIQVLDSHNKRVNAVVLPWGGNIKVSIGTYKIKIVPDRGDCTLNVLMPETTNRYDDNDAYPGEKEGGITIKRSTKQ